MHKMRLRGCILTILSHITNQKSLQHLWQSSTEEGHQAAGFDPVEGQWPGDTPTCSYPKAKQPLATAGRRAGTDMHHGHSQQPRTETWENLQALHEHSSHFSSQLLPQTVHKDQVSAHYISLLKPLREQITPRVQKSPSYHPPSKHISVSIPCGFPRRLITSHSSLGTLQATFSPSAFVFIALRRQQWFPVHSPRVGDPLVPESPGCRPAHPSIPAPWPHRSTEAGTQPRPPPPAAKKYPPSSGMFCRQRWELHWFQQPNHQGFAEHFKTSYSKQNTETLPFITLLGKYVAKSKLSLQERYVNHTIE